MGITRLTALMINGNDVEFVDTPERSECWIKHGDAPHALVLSCPLDRRQEMERAVAEIKAMSTKEILYCPSDPQGARSMTPREGRLNT